MFIKDLYPYKSRVEEDGNNLVAVGWLSDEIEFEIGAVPLDFRDQLSMLCSQPIRKSRGFHVCPFCTKDNAETGNGEIHVAGLGCIYVAPALIGHYVAIHGYKPPGTFVEAVRMKTKNKSNDMSSELAKKVIHLADSPSEENKWAFYKCLLRNRVGIRVPRELGTVPSGDYVTTAESDLRIPTAKSPMGEDMLLVLTDVAWLHQHEPGSVFVEMDGRDLLRVAREAGAGVIVQVLGPGRQAWSGVPAADVRQILVTDVS
jgi:hypothetical protein